MNILVSGGSSGIGAEIVRRLRNDGHDVCFLYNSSEAEAMSLLAETTPLSGETRALACDLADTAGIAVVLAPLLEEGKYLDAFVHAAGVSYDKLVIGISPMEAERTFRINFFSMVEITRLLLPEMLRRRAGYVLAISSIGASTGRRGNSIYSASKAAIEGFLRCLVDEVRNRGVGVNWINPGYIETRMINDYAALEGLVAARVPLKRRGAPAEVASLVSFLVSGSAPYVQGASITMDGGLSAVMGAH